MAQPRPKMYKICGACSKEFSHLALCGPLCFDCCYILDIARGRVHGMVHKAVRNGELPHPAELLCVGCKQPAYGYDHRRYLEPLLVVPVCRGCNRARGSAKDVCQFVKIVLRTGTVFGKSIVGRIAAYNADRRRLKQLDRLIKIGNIVP